jgi:YVTN family beta-propeller protein
MKTKAWKFLSLLFIAIFASSTIGVVHAQSVTATIIVPSGPQIVAYDSVKGEIFVACSNTNSGSFSVSVISDSTNAVLSTINVGVPLSMAYDPGKGEIFVGCEASTIDVISDSTNTVVTTINAGANCLAYDSAKGEIFAFAYTGNLPYAATTTVSVISDTTNAVVTTLTVGKSNSWNIGAAYDSGKSEIFVSNNNDNTVSVISDSTNTVVATVTVGNGPEPVAYDSGKSEIFVVNWMDSTISVISDSTNKVVATIKMIPGPTPTYNSDSMAYVAGKGEMLVETFATSNGNTNSISVISDSTNKVASTINIGSTVNYPQNQAIAYDSAQNEVFMANGGTEASDTVLVVSLSSTTTTPTSTQTATPTSSTSSASPTPKVPEFSSAALVFVLAIMVSVTACGVWLRAKKPGKAA